ncbi:MAG: beta-lactamase family protein [Acidobacteriota bacterium]|nr:beta-lactamase family protein [Acidobacteriota bacterium]
MKRALLLSLVFVASLLSVPAAQAPALDAVLATLDAELAADLAKDGVGGASIAVITGPGAVWTRHYGFADMAAKRAPTGDSVYRIGSITKQFTALALLRQVEAGRMRLSDPLEKYVPEMKGMRRRQDGWSAPTLLQVATMNGGIAREPDLSCVDHSVGPLSVWQQKVVGCLPQTGYASEPGTQHLYSNIGYAALGLAIERAGGAPFTTQVIDGIVTPLGMTRTAWEPTADLRRDLAFGYTRQQGKPDRTQPDREFDGRGYRVPNGNLFSTLTDLTRFVQWELGQIQAPIITRARQTDNYGRIYASNGTLAGGYGVGFQIIRRGELMALGHGGSTAGYRASALFNPTTGTGVVVLRNAEGGTFDATPVAVRILEKVAAARTPAR